MNDDDINQIERRLSPLSPDIAALIAEVRRLKLRGCGCGGGGVDYASRSRCKWSKTPPTVPAKP